MRKSTFPLRFARTRLGPHRGRGGIAVGSTVVQAFIEAGIFALSAIVVLLLIALRRMGDVLLTLLPLLIAEVVTLKLCVVLELSLNFANIIALPLLLGVGVAFKIYYIMAWRAGKTALLQSSLARAVVFSAMTTATASAVCGCPTIPAPQVGKVDGAGIGLHHGGGGVLSACFNGAAPEMSLAA